MPNRDGTGPKGRGSRDGRGQGRGRETSPGQGRRTGGKRGNCK